MRSVWKGALSVFLASSVGVYGGNSPFQEDVHESHVVQTVYWDMPELEDDLLSQEFDEIQQQREEFVRLERQHSQALAQRQALETQEEALNPQLRLAQEETRWRHIERRIEWMEWGKNLCLVLMVYTLRNSILNFFFSSAKTPCFYY